MEALIENRGLFWKIIYYIKNRRVLLIKVVTSNSGSNANLDVNWANDRIHLLYTSWINSWSDADMSSILSLVFWNSLMRQLKG